MGYKMIEENQIENRVDIIKIEMGEDGSIIEEEIN